jgi:branched-chain amino acid transport system substrate-binding protein
VFEIVEQTLHGRIHHRAEFRIVIERYTATPGGGDDARRQPLGSPTPGRCEQFPGGRTRFEALPVVGVGVTRHVVSSIVTVVSSPHRRVAVVAWIVALIGSSGCTAGDEPDPPLATAPATSTTAAVERELDGRLVLGVYLPQTGPGSTLGQPMIAAVEAMVAEINRAGGVLGDDVGIVILDEGAPAGPASLLEQGVDAIVGPASSRNALAHLASVVGDTTGVVTCSPAATALSLDDYPDNGYFFRTVASDSLQMAAIARRAERTGASTVAVGYLDDPYGRGLARALIDEVEERRRQLVVDDVPFSPDQEDLAPVVDRLLEGSPGVVVVLGDADDGGRLLTALDTRAPQGTFQIVVNDSIRTAAAIQQLSAGTLARLTAVAPVATSDGGTGYFTAQVTDCVTLIALATVEANSDDPSEIRLWMAPVSGGGRQCTEFADCVALQQQNLQIDYNGRSGPIEWSSTSGDPTRAPFEQFGFDDSGVEIDRRIFDVP